MRLGQRLDLEAHILRVADPAVQYQHRRSGAKGFTIDADVIDTDMLTAVGLARKNLPEIELTPSAHWRIQRIDRCAPYCCKPYESDKSRGQIFFAHWKLLSSLARQLLRLFAK